MRRLVLWTGLDGWRAEAASVDVTARGLSASGTQLGVDPVPYRADYDLDAGEGFVTRSLQVEVTGEGWWRGIGLFHDGAGGWRCETQAQGDVDLTPPGGDVDALTEALHCDLALSPVTNAMPILRHELHERPGAEELVVAWVSLPDLAVTASTQRYEHVRESVVRFASRETAAELELDANGLPIVYPGLARRVEPAAPAA